MIPVTYILSELEANSATVRPAGTWKLTIGTDNTVTWEVINPVDEEGHEVSEVNRTVNLETPRTPAYLGDTFKLYNDVKPKITFDPTGGKLSGKEDSSSRTDTVDFNPTELSHTYTIEEPNPTRDNSVFRVWSTVKNPVEGDGHKEYKYGDEILFYRHTDDDDLTLYAQWSSVVCKITDRDDNLLYINGSPAVFMSLKDGFDAFNEAKFTLSDGTTKATPRKLKMLVPDYEMTETVELARGKIMEFMTAPSTDTDGYAGPTSTCVITRASSFDTDSMIIDNYNLVLREIILDGALKDSEGNTKPINGNGGIITVTGNASHLTLATDAILRNATVSGNGGAVYADDNTIVTVSDGGSITGCQAANGGAVHANASTTVNLSGGEISGSKATANGGAVYASGTVNMSGSAVKSNTASANGGGLYLTANAVLTMTGGNLSENNAASGGGVYSDGSVVLNNANAVISGNTASANGGGVYVGESGSLTLTAGSIGAEDSPNKAANGSGVYLAGKATLTGGSISYNGAEDSVNGGGIYLVSASEITLGGTGLSHNQAANGGAVYAVKPEGAGTDITLTLTKGTISDNTAFAYGGGVYLASGVSLNMTGGTVDSNSAVNGGGVYTASGGGMTLTGGTVSKNVTTGNGAGVYVEGSSDTSYGTLRVESGSIRDNTADGLGGAVYLQGYGQLHVSGGTISYNVASGINGGAINAEGTNARIYLSGTPTIFNNPGNAVTHSQKNLVLSEDQNDIINTSESGLNKKVTNSGSMLRAAADITGIVGVYVIDGDGDNVYTEHGVYDKPFGTFGDSDNQRINAKNLVNDRNLALYGVDKNDGIIYWKDVVCKITNASDEILYQRINVDDSGVFVYVPAVYTSLKDGFDAVSGSLYRKIGSSYATFNTGAVKVKMLKDYTLDENEIITYTTARDVTLTTAETEPYNNDGYFYKPSQEGQTKATFTRAQTSNSMFTVNTPNRFNVSNIIIDGGSNTMMTQPGVNGGAFNIQAVSSSVFSGVTLKNLNATGNGGAICLNSGSLTLTDSTINGNSAANGAGIYLTENANLNLSGNLNFGGTGAENGALVTQYVSGEAAGNFVTWGYTAEANERNGGKNYTNVRQDIYITGTATPHSAIRVTGDISSGDGTIWVWADHENHYEMLKQFAVYTGSGTVQEATMRAFRNAQPDSRTNCGGDYLTGQKGEHANWIYWTGGFDVVFLKTDAYGKALPGATFTLYSDPACTETFDMTFTGSTPATGDGKRPTTVSSDGTATYKDKNGNTVTLEKGEVLLSKVPPKTLYLKETEPAPGYNRDENKTTVYQVIISGTGELTMMKKGTSGEYDTEVFKETRQRTAGELEQYVVMNLPEAQRKVILRKVNGSFNPLPGKTFTISYYDGTEAATGTSTDSGVIWVGVLPYGVYTIKEDSGEKFTLTVGDDTVNVSKTAELAPGSRDGVTVKANS